MDNLLLAALKPETAPVRNEARTRDRVAPDRGDGPSAFDRELDEAVRERRDAAADRRAGALDNPERARDAEQTERTETARDSDDSPHAETDSTGETAQTAEGAPGDAGDAADPDAAADVDGPTDVAVATSEEAASATGEAIATDEVIAAIEALGAAKQPDTAVAVGDPVPDANDAADPDDPDKTTKVSPVAGPAAIAIAATGGSRAVAAGPEINGAPVSGTDTAAGLAASRPRADFDSKPPEIGTSPDTASGDGEGGEPGARPGRSAAHASDRALAVRAAFSGVGAGIDRSQQAPAPRASIADAFGTPAPADAAAADGRGQPDTQAVTLRLTPVNHSSRLSSIPVNTLAFHIARNFDKGINRFEIRLDPPELGRVDVRMEVDGDARVRVHLVVQRAEALDFLQRDARALERALTDAGLGADADSLSFSLDTGNHDTSGDDAASAGDRPVPAAPLAEVADEEPLPSPTHYVSRSGIDIHV